jgi:hypothetical protein
MELLETLAAGGDMAAMAILVMCVRFHTRLVKVEIEMEIIRSAAKK